MKHDMAAGPDERLRFGERLKERREERPMTRQALIDAVNEATGMDYTPQAVYAWETGRNLPPLNIIRVVEDILELDSELLTILGYDHTPTTDERLTALEESVTRIEAALRRVSGDEPAP